MTTPGTSGGASMESPEERGSRRAAGPLAAVICFCLENKLVVILTTLMIIGWGILVAPFDWDIRRLPRDPVPVDAIPDIGENQQIVFTEWMGRSPQDVEDQITYPLTVVAARHPRRQDDPQLLVLRLLVDLRHLRGGRRVLLVALPHPREAEQPSRRHAARRTSSRRSAPTRPRSGRSSGTRSRAATATATRPAAGTSTSCAAIQDWYVRYALHVGRGRQRGRLGRRLRPRVPDRRRPRRDARLRRDARARSSTRCGCRTSTSAPARIEVNRVEYVIRGLGFIEEPRRPREHRGQGQRQRAGLRQGRRRRASGPRCAAARSTRAAPRRSAASSSSATATNPLAAIKNVKEKIAEISPGLPAEDPRRRHRLAGDRSCPSTTAPG